MLFSMILVVSALASLSIASPLLSRNNQFCVPQLKGRSVSIETGAFGPKAAWAFDTALGSPGEGSPVDTEFFRDLQPPQFKIEFTGGNANSVFVRSQKCPRLVVSTSLTLTPKNPSPSTIFSQSWRINCKFCAKDASSVSGIVASGCRFEAEDTDGSCVESDGITNHQLFLKPCDRSVREQQWNLSTV